MSLSFVFTCNNYTDAHEAHLKSLDFTYLLYGREVGESGTPHLQGYIRFKTSKRLPAAIKLLTGCHVEKAKGNAQQNVDYCKKDKDFYEEGTPPAQGKRTDLDQATKLLKEGAAVSTVALELPSVFVKFHRGLKEFALICQKPYDHDDVRGIWYYGKPGSGKSYSARLNTPYYLKPQNKWFDGYSGEPTIILDDFDKGGECLGHHLKIWTDRYSCTGETKGGTVQLRHTQFIITSNYRMTEIFSEPEIQAALARRFKFKNFDLTPEKPPRFNLGEGN